VKKSQLNKLQPGSAAYVIAHAKWAKSRGRRPSMSYRGILNPLEALLLAHYELDILQQVA